MRNVKLLALVGVMMLALASCKKDSDTSKFSIVGKWNVDLFSEKFGYDSFEQENYGTIEFNEDNTGTFDKKGDFTWVYVSSGKMLTITLDRSFTVYNYKLSKATSSKVVGSYNESYGSAKYEGEIELSKIE